MVDIRSIAFLLVGILFLCIGLYLFYVQISIYMQGAATTSWPSAQGTIISSTITNFTACYSTKNGENCYPAYRPSITYSYAVDTVSYTENTISLGHVMSGNDYSYAASEVAKYPASSDVSVHYNPNLPSESVLEPGGNGLSTAFVALIPILLGGIVTIVILKGMLSVRRLNRIPPQQSNSKKV